jgi:hypothetical protein
MRDERTKAMNRRNLFRAVGGASTAAVAGAAVAFNPGEAEAYDPGEEEMKSRYRETDHVKAFYRVNGYPAKSE